MAGISEGCPGEGLHTMSSESFESANFSSENLDEDFTTGNGDCVSDEMLVEDMDIDTSTAPSASGPEVPPQQPATAGASLLPASNATLPAPTGESKPRLESKPPSKTNVTVAPPRSLDSNAVATPAVEVAAAVVLGPLPTAQEAAEARKEAEMPLGTLMPESDNASTSSLQDSTAMEICAPEPAPVAQPQAAPLPQEAAESKDVVEWTLCATSSESDATQTSSPLAGSVPDQADSMFQEGTRRRRRSAEQAQQKLKSKPKTTSKRKRNPKTKPVEDPQESGPFQPSRTYYHSNTFQKFRDHEWENDVDSDDEVDQSWTLEVMRSVIHEYTDFSEGQKSMCILWNEYVASDTMIPASRVPQLCLDFVEKHHQKICEDGLEEELPFHLCNLWDQGLISADHLSFCIDHYHKLVGSPPVELLDVTDKPAISLKLE